MRQIITDFKAGELDPFLAMRVDSKAYPSGAQSLKNCILYNTGGVSRRPGTFYLADYTARVRLAGFEFDEDEKYVLGFGPNLLAIHDELGNPIATFTGAANCPWNAITMHELTYAQAGDIMIICHRLFKSKVLTRTGLSSFTITDFAFDAAANNAEIFQPYIKFTNPNVTLAISAVSGAGITVTASSPTFSALYVGLTIRIYKVELTITGFTSPTVVTATAKKIIEHRLDPNPFLYTDASPIIEVTDAFHGLTNGASVTFSGANDDSDVSRLNINGARTITVIDEDHYTFVTGGTDNSNESQDAGGPAVKVQSLAATRNWDEQAFSAVRGFPQAVAFHEDRLWLAGSTEVPDGLFASRTGDYFDFDVAEGEADASIQITIGSTRIANIRHIVSNRVLQVFAQGSEFVAKQADGAGLTPSNINIRNQTPYGSSALRPRVFDGATMFFQENNKTMREFLFSFNEDGFSAADITTLSAHLITKPIAFDVMYGTTTRPEQYAFVVNEDTGTMAVFHSIRNEGLAAWLPWETTTGHKFDSVLTLGTKVFVTALRGGIHRLERIDFDGRNRLDSAKTMTAAATVTWNLGPVYAGQTVKVVSGNFFLGTFTANGAGVITINDEVTEITAGYDYEWKVVPMPPDTQLTNGPTTGRKRRVSSAIIHCLDTFSLTVNGKAVVVRQAGFNPADPPVPLTGKIKQYILGHSRDPVVALTQGEPLPVTILGIVMEVSV